MPAGTYAQKNKIVFKVTKLAWFPARVKAAAYRSQLSFFHKAGLEVRNTAVSYIKYQKNGTNSPGGFPTAKPPNKLRPNIQYAVIPSKKMVVIGPESLPPQSGVGNVHHLEMGGRGPFKIKGGSIRQGNFKARPFMRPSLDAVSPKLGPLWQNIINKNFKP